MRVVAVVLLAGLCLFGMAGVATVYYILSSDPAAQCDSLSIEGELDGSVVFDDREVSLLPLGLTCLWNSPDGDQQELTRTDWISTFTAYPAIVVGGVGAVIAALPRKALSRARRR